MLLNPAGIHENSIVGLRVLKILDRIGFLCCIIYYEQS